MEMTKGEKVGVSTRIHRRDSKGKNQVILRTSEGYFQRFHGEKSAIIRFFRENGTHVDQTVLLTRIKPVGKEP